LACSASCPIGQFIVLPCNATHDITCDYLPLVETGGSVKYFINAETQRGVELGHAVETVYSVNGTDSLNVTEEFKQIVTAQIAAACNVSVSRISISFLRSEHRRLAETKLSYAQLVINIIASSANENRITFERLQKNPSTNTSTESLLEKAVSAAVAGAWRGTRAKQVSAPVIRCPAGECEELQELLVNNTAVQQGGAVGVQVAPAGVVSYNGLLSGMTIELENAREGDVLNTVDVDHLNLEEIVLSLGKIMLRGENTAKAYQLALRSVVFRSDTMTDVARPLKVEVCAQGANGGVCSDPGFTAIETDESRVDRAPRCTMGSTLATFLQEDSEVQLAPSLSISDVDSSTLRWATMTIHNNQPGDTLSYILPDDSPLEAVFNESIGELRISCRNKVNTTLPIALFEQVLRSVSFFNAFGEPPAGAWEEGLRTIDRQIGCQADDGAFRGDAAPTFTTHICPRPGFGTFLCPVCEVFRCRGGTFSPSYFGPECQSSCPACPVGTVSTAGSNACQDCPKGTAFRPTSNGAVTELVGFSGETCAECATGQYSNHTRALTCTKCAAGKYGDHEIEKNSENHCKPCLAGQYQSKPGSSFCLNWRCCPKGSYSVGASASAGGTCKSCPTGKYSRASSCTAEPCSQHDACGPGMFLDGASSTSPGQCTFCPVGKHKVGTGVGMCQSCPAGQFGSQVQATRPSVCNACPTGKYQEHAGQGSCVSCCTDCYGDDAIATSNFAHCQQCAFGAWGAYSECSRTCFSHTGETGQRVRVRRLVTESQYAVLQCRTSDTIECSGLHACPEPKTCVYTKCHFGFNKQTKQIALQVSHHGSEPYDVHHCRITEIKGEKACQCTCTPGTAIAASFL
jgi:hypothetical protein